MRLTTALVCALALSRASAQSTTVPLGDLRVTALARTADSGRVLRTSVTLANPEKESVKLEIAADCPVVARVYETRGGRGTPVWDGSLSLCFDMSRNVQIAGRSSITLSRVDSVAHILGDSLSPGRYRIEALLRLSRGRRNIPAGTAVLRR